MGQFSMEIMPIPGSLLIGNQHLGVSAIIKGVCSRLGHYALLQQHP